MKITLRTEKSTQGGVSNIKNKYSSSQLGAKFKQIGSKGLNKLKLATPVRSGKTSSDWNMEIEDSKDKTIITYSNNNVTKDGTPIVILIKNGHGTGTGGYVPPNDFITPVIDDILESIIKEVDRSGYGKK